MYMMNPAQNSQNMQLDLSTFFQLSRKKQRRILGQHLYPMVYSIYPNFMPHKLTDILLDINSTGLLVSMLNDLELFHLKLKDAVNVLQTYYAMVKSTIEESQ
ncbi:PREDICTED: polyadenylate-binding protein-like [Trachymyrmex septentrionalis]|nr:PREDICTED: polyadenylate-binding protein-like [Trachymyrmex septentrionalis]